MMHRLSPVSRAPFSLLPILGFRFAPPQALCCRRASRALYKTSTRKSGTGNRVLFNLLAVYAIPRARAFG